MKRYKLPILTLVVVVIAALVSWPLVHTALIRLRIKKAIRESTDPHPRASVVERGISELDPPAKILHVLWELALSPESTKSEMQHAGLVLGMLSQKVWSLRTGDYYDQSDWDEAFSELLAKERAHPVKRSAMIDSWIVEIDREWNASPPLSKLPP